MADNGCPECHVWLNFGCKGDEGDAREKTLLLFVLAALFRLECMLKSVPRAAFFSYTTLRPRRGPLYCCPRVQLAPSTYRPLVRSFRMSAPVEANLHKDEVTGEMVSKS